VLIGGDMIPIPWMGTHRPIWRILKDKAEQYKRLGIFLFTNHDGVGGGAWIYYKNCNLFDKSTRRKHMPGEEIFC
jgi:hypothetical protein